jgi:hypothetical protein
MINLINRTGEVEDSEIKTILTDYLYSRKLSIKKDILEYSFIDHHSSEWYYHEFIDVDLNKCEIELIKVSNEKLLDISYANFVSDGIKTEYDWIDIPDLRSYKENTFANGTWIHPILVIDREGTYVTMDGNNRLKFLRSMIKYNKEIIAPIHKLYLLKF